MPIPYFDNPERYGTVQNGNLVESLSFKVSSKERTLNKTNLDLRKHFTSPIDWHTITKKYSI